MAYEIRNSNMYIKKYTLNVSKMARRNVRILNLRSSSQYLLRSLEHFLRDCSKKCHVIVADVSSANEMVKLKIYLHSIRQPESSSLAIFSFDRKLFKNR